MIIMKLSTLLLSSAAVLVAGAAFAADLPAKKAAPAAAPTGCAAFGAGFFQIPGGDNCIKFSGRVTADQTFASTTSRTTSVDTFGSGFRLNTDVRSNTDAGVVRAFSRIQGSAAGSMTVKYAYAQIGSLTAGYADSAFISLNNPWGWQISTDDGKVTNLLSYTASLGGTTSATVSVEDATYRTSSSMGASQVPDVVGAIKTKMGDNTLQLSAATHQNHGSTSGDLQGYAFQAGVTLPVTKDTTFYAQAAYANAALSYLGYTSLNTTYVTAASVVDATLTTVATGATGWSVYGAVSQNVGPGSLNLSGVYGDITTITATDVKQSQVELNYDYTGIKGVQIIPSVYVYNQDDGAGTTHTTTTGFLRIERDF